MNGSLVLFVCTLNGCLGGRGSFTPEELGPGVMKASHCFLSRHFYFKPCRLGRTVIGITRKNVFIKTLSEKLMINNRQTGRV